MYRSGRGSYQKSRKESKRHKIRDFPLERNSEKANDEEGKESTVNERGKRLALL